MKRGFWISPDNVLRSVGPFTPVDRIVTLDIKIKNKREVVFDEYKRRGIDYKDRMGGILSEF